MTTLSLGFITLDPRLEAVDLGARESALSASNGPNCDTPGTATTHARLATKWLTPTAAGPCAGSDAASAFHPNIPPMNPMR